jgi:hypothetical protein
MHTGHTACQNVPKKAFPLKIFFSRTKSDAEKLNTVNAFFCPSEALHVLLV